MLSATMMDVLSARAIDVELADRLGLESKFVAGTDRLAFPFLREGRVVRRKYWNPAPEEGETKWTADKGGIRAPFNEDCLRDDSLTALPLIITEGEFDCMAILQSGHARAISVPDGAPQEPVSDPAASAKYAWIEELRPLLTQERVREIVLCTDDDDPGAALRHDLSVLLGRYRCKFVVYPFAKRDRGRERCKDMNDVLADYGPAGVQKVLARASWLKITGVHRMSELPALPQMVLYEVPGFTLFREHFKLRLGDFSVFTGTPGYGKTTFVNDLMCRIAVEHGLTIAWASFEQEPQRDHKRNLRSWFCAAREIDLDRSQLAAADRWIEETHLFIVPSEDEDASLEWLLDKLEVAVTRYGAKIVVIDPWNEIEHSRRQGETETEYIGRAIRALKRFAKAFQVHMCVVAHPTKSVKDEGGTYKMPTLYDISGSANWYNKCDLGVIVHRPTLEETDVKVQKSRYHEVIGKPGTVRMHFSKDERRYIETERLA